MSFYGETSGYLGAPLGTCVAHYTDAQSLSVSTATETTLKPGTVQYNSGSCYDSSTGIYTCPVDGVYNVSGSAVFNGAGAYYCFAGIYVNDIPIVVGVADQDSYNYPQVAGMVYADADDEITIKVYQSSGSSQTIYTTWEINRIAVMPFKV